MQIGNRTRDAALGGGVAVIAATLFIAATFIWSGAPFTHAAQFVPAAAAYAVLMSWFIVPLGGLVGLQISRITGDGRLSGILARSALAAAFVTLAGSLLLRAPVDLYRVMTRTAPFHEGATWWADARGTLLYFVPVGLYSFPWIVWFAWHRSRLTSAARRAESPRAER